MRSTHNIISALPTIPSTATRTQALKAIAASKRIALPVVETDGSYVGMLTADDCAEEDEELTAADMSLPTPAYRATDTPLAMLRSLTERDSDTVPVVDIHDRLVGCIDRQDALGAISHLGAVDEPGSTVAVTMDNVNYEIAKLTLIAEQTGAKILNISTDRGAESTTVMLRLAQTDAGPVLNALERHGYMTTALTDLPAEESKDMARRNYDALMRYLSIG